MGKGEAKKEKKLQWWQLSLLGVAFTIGTGYFLGSSIAIELAGPSVIITFLLASIGTYMVFDLLAKMTAADPQKGSFRSYAKKAYGRWAGFTSGWVYWCAELLMMGSQLTALSLFSRFWFPDVPMWIFAAGYGVLGLLVMLMGTKGFERLENVFAVVKLAAIVMFLILAAAALFGWIDGGKYPPEVPRTVDTFFRNGIMGLWSSFIFAFYAFGGIEVLGLMAIRLQHPKDAPKAGKIMLIALTTVYVISLGLAVILVPWNVFSSQKSPFVVALDGYNMSFVPHVFNAVFIIAGFSTMVASLFAVTTILVTLAEDRDAPPVFAKQMKRKLPLPALGMTTLGLLAAILLALLLPEKLYKYVTTAAGLMLLYNWFLILVVSRKLVKLEGGWNKAKPFFGMTLILLAVSGTLFHPTSRPGFFISLAFLVLIGGITIVMRTVWKRRRRGGGQKEDEEQASTSASLGEAR